MTLKEIEKLKTKHSKEIADEVRKYVKSHLDKLEDLKKFIFISHGKGGYQDGVLSLLRDNLISLGGIYIDVETGNLLEAYSRKNTLALDESIVDIGLYHFDVDEMYQSYKKEAYEGPSDSVSAVFSYESFIAKSIFLDIDLSFKDFKGHYQQLTDLNEKQFLEIKDFITAEVAKLILKGVDDDRVFGDAGTYISCGHRPITDDDPF